MCAGAGWPSAVVMSLSINTVVGGFVIRYMYEWMDGWMGTQWPMCYCSVTYEYQFGLGDETWTTSSKAKRIYLLAYDSSLKFTSQQPHNKPPTAFIITTRECANKWISRTIFIVMQVSLARSIEDDMNDIRCAWLCMRILFQFSIENVIFLICTIRAMRKRRDCILIYAISRMRV